MNPWSTFLLPSVNAVSHLAPGPGGLPVSPRWWHSLWVTQIGLSFCVLEQMSVLSDRKPSCSLWTLLSACVICRGCSFILILYFLILFFKKTSVSFSKKTFFHTLPQLEAASWLNSGQWNGNGRCSESIQREHGETLDCSEQGIPISLSVPLVVYPHSHENHGLRALLHGSFLFLWTCNLCIKVVASAKQWDLEVVLRKELWAMDGKKKEGIWLPDKEELLYHF